MMWVKAALYIGFLCWAATWSFEAVMVLWLILWGLESAQRGRTV